MCVYDVGACAVEDVKPLPISSDDTDEFQRSNAASMKSKDRCAAYTSKVGLVNDTITRIVVARDECTTFKWDQK